MKKYLLAFFLVLFTSSALAGFAEFYSSFNDDYDRETGLLFTTVTEYGEGGFLKSSDQKIIDIFIFSPDQGKGTYLFGNKNKNRITEFIFESHFEDQTSAMIFNLGDSYLIKNNTFSEKRKPKNRLLVSTYDDSREAYTLWSAAKDGQDLTKIKEIPKGTSWHIDVRNSKIRFVAKKNKQVSIESIEW